MIAYHYTTAANARLIRASGRILPATAHVGPEEAPVVWFSSETTWEPTASKAVVDIRSGYCRTLTFPEMVKVQVARFGVDTSLLVPWNALKKESGMTDDTASARARAGRRQGANPRNWYGYFGVLDLSEIQTQEQYGPGGWVPTGGGVWTL